MIWDLSVCPLKPSFRTLFYSADRIIEQNTLFCLINSRFPRNRGGTCRHSTFRGKSVYSFLFSYFECKFSLKKTSSGERRNVIYGDKSNIRGKYVDFLIGYLVVTNNKLILLYSSAWIRNTICAPFVEEKKITFGSDWRKL